MRKFLKSLLLSLALVAAPAVASAQVDTATISTSGADCSTSTNCAVFGLRSYEAIGVYVDVATSGTFVFEATTGADPATATWFAINDDVAAAGTATADGYFTFSNPGYSYIRLRASAISGAATVTASRGFSGLRSTATLSGSAQGDGAIQDGANGAIEATVADLTNSNPLAAMIVDATGAQITSFGGGTQYAVDAALGATPTGTLSVAIRDDVLSSLTPTEGDAVGLRVNSDGALWVALSGGSVNIADGGNTITVDNGGTFATQAAQSGTWTVQPGNTANTTPWLTTIAQGGNSAEVNASGQLSVVCANCSGTGVSVNEDVAAASADPGTPAYTVREDTPTGNTSADGDYQPLKTDNIGQLWVNSELAAAATLADNTANPSITSIAAYNMCFDGSTWDRCLSSSLTEVTHDSVMTAGSTVGNATMLLSKDFDGSALPNSVSAEGDAVIGAASTSGVQYVMMVNEDGSATGQVRLWDGTDTVLIDGSGNLAVSCSNCSGSGVSVNEDVASADSQPGTPAFTVRNDTVTGATSANGDYQPLKGDANGALWVNPFSTTPAAGTYLPVRLSDGSNFLSASTDYTHNGALTADSTTGPMSMRIAKDFDGAALPNTVSAEGDAVMPAASLSGVQYVMIVSEDGSLERGTSTTPMIVGDGTGALNVICDSGCAGGTQYTHDAALTAGSTIGTAEIMLAADFDGAALPSAVSAEGDAVLAKASLSGVQYVMIVSEDGALERGTSTTPMVVGDGTGALNVICDSGCSGGTQYAIDAVAGAADLGSLALVVRDDALATLTPADGDYTQLRVDSTGRLWTTSTVVGISGTVSLPTGASTLAEQQTQTTALQLIDNIVNTEDAVFADGGSGVPLLAVRDATPGNTSGAEGDLEPLQTNGGRLWVDASGVTLTVASHAVTNAGTFAVQVDGAALTALQLIDNTVFAEDAAHNSTDSGNFVLGRRIDTLAASSGTSGDYEAFNMNASGALWVAPTASTNGGASGLSYVSVGTTEDEHAVKASAGTLYSVTVTNTNAAVRYLRCEDDTAANTAPGTDTPEFSLAIPGAATGAGFSTTFPVGWSFTNALTCWVVTGAAVSDVAEVAANEIQIFYTYK